MGKDPEGGFEDIHLIFDRMKYPLSSFCAFTAKKAHFAKLVDVIANPIFS